MLAYLTLFNRLSEFCIRIDWIYPDYFPFHCKCQFYFITAVVGGIALLGLVETLLTSSEGKRLQFNVLKTAFILQFGLLVVRALNTTYGLLTSIIYQEDVLEAALRCMVMGSTLLIFISINNILFENVLGLERKKAIDSELKMLSSLNALAMARDHETGAHIAHTQEYVRCLANRIKSQGNDVEELSDYAIENMYKALHHYMVSARSGFQMEYSTNGGRLLKRSGGS